MFMNRVATYSICVCRLLDPFEIPGIQKNPKHPYGHGFYSYFPGLAPVVQEGCHVLPSRPSTRLFAVTIFGVFWTCWEPGRRPDPGWKPSDCYAYRSRQLTYSYLTGVLTPSDFYMNTRGLGGWSRLKFVRRRTGIGGNRKDMTFEGFDSNAYESATTSYTTVIWSSPRPLDRPLPFLAY